MRTDSPTAWSEVSACVEAFEEAWSQRGKANLQDYLPDRSHPQFAHILRELACVELELTWSNRSHRVEDYLTQYPELVEEQEELAALAYQEFRLRRQAGERATLAEYARRFGIDTSEWRVPEDKVMPPAAADRPTWRDQAASLYENYRAKLDTEIIAAPFPGSLVHADLLLQFQGVTSVDEYLADPAPGVRPGSDFAGFRLVAELGRGTFGRVFLAEQAGLANRRVALKVGADLYSESQNLAQFQHTNIMPIYSVHRDGFLQAVCMPYFGSTTLSDVLDTMRRSRGVSTPNNPLWITLQKRRPALSAGEGMEAPPSSTPSTLTTLQSLNHVQAVLWLAVRLAEGLAHAHERGIVHRDIKPSNVLLGDDGQPLLLDFNLSNDIRLRAGVPALFGGTLAYMAPEHLEAFAGGRQVVDARSDIYSLGLLLYEMMAGSHPFPVQPGPVCELMPRLIADRLKGCPPIRAKNPAVTPAVESILRHCLEPRPEKRYQTANQLREDVHRQLNDLPLRYAPEPSLRERARKWNRRHPRVVWVVGVALLAALLGGISYRHVSQQREVLRIQSANTRHEFRMEQRDARILLSLPFPTPDELEEGEKLCRQALSRFGLPDDSTWDRRAPFTTLDSAEQAVVRSDCSELLLLLARATWLRAMRDSNPTDRQEAIEEAMRLNAMAGSCSGGDNERSLKLQRALLMRLAGREDEAHSLLAIGQTAPPQGGREHYLIGGEKLGQGLFHEALVSLSEASRKEPDNAAIWAAKGACYMALGQPDRAAACYDVCIALRPDFWRGYLWRGQAYLEQKEYRPARDDFDAVARFQTGLVDAHFFRALARFGLKDFKGAEDDLSRVLELDPGHTRLYFTRARVRGAAGDKEGARRDFEEGLRREPTDELSWTVRGEARIETDPKGALADFNAALKLNPWARNAAQSKAHVLAEKLGRTKDAIEVLNRLVERYPGYVSARAGRGVLLARLGNRAAALKDAEEALRQNTSGLNLYQVACIYALTSRQEKDDRLEAIRLLSRALKANFGTDLIEVDPDLAPLHPHPEFARVVELARSLRKAG